MPGTSGTEHRWPRHARPARSDGNAECPRAAAEPKAELPSCLRGKAWECDPRGTDPDPSAREAKLRGTQRPVEPTAAVPVHGSRPVTRTHQVGSAEGDRRPQNLSRDGLDASCGQSRRRKPVRHAGAGAEWPPQRFANPECAHAPSSKTRSSKPVRRPPAVRPPVRGPLRRAPAPGLPCPVGQTCSCPRG